MRVSAASDVARTPVTLSLTRLRSTPTPSPFTAMPVAQPLTSMPVSVIHEPSSATHGLDSVMRGRSPAP